MAKNEDGRPGVSDEEWARFVEQAERGAGEAPVEPSARARMVAERLRREAARGAEPPGWRTGPAWQEMEGRGRGRRRLKAALAVVFIAALALIIVRPELVIDKITGEAQARQDAGSAAPLPAETVRPTAPPEVALPDRPTLKDPFRGSPALDWADGEAGIEVPEAQAVGGMSKDQVADALAKARQLLVTSNLDPATLRGERPETALKLLEPKREENRSLFLKALEQPGKDQDPIWLFTRFQPTEVKLVGDVVKTRGRMTFAAGEQQGEVKVNLDYTFVYPLVQAAPGSDHVERTIVRRQIEIYMQDPAEWQVTSGTLQLGKYAHEFGNALCGVYDGYLHPYFGSGLPQGVEPSGQAVDPYDRSKDLAGSEAEECHETTRS